jgi:hypothetical protein
MILTNDTLIIISLAVLALLSTYLFMDRRR